MWALILEVIGPFVARYMEKEAAQLVLKRFGVAVLKKFAQEVAIEDLKSMTTKEILEKAAEIAKNRAQSKILTPSNAKKFANAVNSKIDRVEQLGRNWAQRKVIATGAEELGIQQNVGKAATSKAGKFFVNDVMGRIILPTTKGEAFGSGYLRGLTGESLSRAVNRLIEFALQVPKTATDIPKYRKFIRTITGEIRYLRSIGELGSAEKLWKAAKLSYNTANAIYPGSPHLGRWSAAGNVAGRATVVLGLDFAFVDSNERQDRIDRFKDSLIPFAKNQARIHVEGYTRADGTKVHGYYRQRRKPQHVSAHQRANTPVGAYYRNTP